jgi:hypothetical protein
MSGKAPLFPGAQKIAIRSKHSGHGILIQSLHTGRYHDSGLSVFDDKVFQSVVFQIQVDVRRQSTGHCFVQAGTRVNLYQKIILIRGSPDMGPEVLILEMEMVDGIDQRTLVHLGSLLGWIGEIKKLEWFKRG